VGLCCESVLGLFCGSVVLYVCLFCDVYMSLLWVSFVGLFCGSLLRVSLCVSSDVRMPLMKCAHFFFVGLFCGSLLRVSFVSRLWVSCDVRMSLV